MTNVVVSLIIAIVGVGGTLASALLTQRSAQRARLIELELQERQRLADQDAIERREKTAELKACCVRLASSDRNYRDALLAYAYALLQEAAPESSATELAEARRAQRDARAEAQLLLSDEILTVEAPLDSKLTEAYRGLKLAEREPDLAARAARLKDVMAALNEVVRMLHRVHVAMRLDLGVIGSPPDWY